VDKAAKALSVKSRTEAIHITLNEVLALKRFKKLMSGGKLAFAGHNEGFRYT
jgi:hypothetical protein